jgi:PEP-CTERM motif-containing protein
MQSRITFQGQKKLDYFSRIDQKRWHQHLKRKTMSRHNRTLTPLLLLVASLLFAAQAGAVNLIQNGSFQLNNFTDWTIGTTSNGTWGSGYPVVSAWPLGGMNAAQGEVGEVTFDQTQQGGTLTQTFVSAGGAATETLLWAATDPFSGNLDGGEFTMILNGVQIAQIDSGQIAQNQTLTGTLSASASLLAGTNTLEIVVSRRFITVNNGTPFQFVTGVDVEGAVPEPSSMVLLGVGALGLAGVLRRKVGF